MRHKTLVDASTMVSLTPMIAFLPAQWIGYSNFKYEQSSYITMMAIPLIMFAADFASEALIQRKKPKGD